MKLDLIKVYVTMKLRYPAMILLDWIGIEMVAGLQCLFVKIYLILLGKI